jgi:hypothetical protein
VGGEGAGAADDGDDVAVDEAAEQGEMYPYTYPTEAYDEFGDKLDQVAGLEGHEGHEEGGAAAAAGGGGGEAAAAGDAAGGAAAGQQQQQQQQGDQQQQQLRDLGDATYNGGWNDDMWEDEMFRQVRHSSAAVISQAMLQSQHPTCDCISRFVLSLSGKNACAAQSLHGCVLSSIKSKY